MQAEGAIVLAILGTMCGILAVVWCVAACIRASAEDAARGLTPRLREILCGDDGEDFVAAWPVLREHATCEAHIAQLNDSDWETIEHELGERNLWRRARIRRFRCALCRRPALPPRDEAKYPPV